MSHIHILLLLVAAGCVTGCAVTYPEDEREIRVVDEGSLLRYLTDEGLFFTVRHPSTFTGIGVQTVGTEYRGFDSDERLSVYQFRTLADADVAVAPALRRRASTSYTQVFQRGRLVVYASNRLALTSALERALGPPLGRS